MDRDAVEYQLRLVYAAARDGKDPVAAARTVFELDALGRLLLDRSFRFEPDLERRTDATPARMSGLRPVPGKDLPPPGPNCACHECVRSRGEGRAPNSLQHYGRVGRVQGLEGKETLVSLRAIPGGARPEERPSERYIDDSADDAPKAG